MLAIVATRALPCSNPHTFEPRDLPDPTPGDHDLLIRVEAVGVNPVDTKVRASLPQGAWARQDSGLGWSRGG